MHCTHMGMLWMGVSNPDIKMKIIAKKKMTNYGIATCVTRILECIVRDERSIMTVSVRAEHAGDANGVVLSMPAILGANGVESKVPLRLNYDEKRQLKESADAMRTVMAQVEL